MLFVTLNIIGVLPEQFQSKANLFGKPAVIYVKEKEFDNDISLTLEAQMQLNIY